jgi:hypothetical protein
LKELFYKPCFGTKEEYLDYKFVPQNNLIQRISSHLFNTDIRPQLVKNTSSKLPNEENAHEIKLYVVSLPDFTVYPDDAIESPNNNLIINLLNGFFGQEVM